MKVNNGGISAISCALMETKAKDGAEEENCKIWKDRNTFRDM
jgi:hypothetical protein